MKGHQYAQTPHPYAFLACRLSSKQLRAHCREGGAASQPGERAATLLAGKLMLVSYAPRSQHKPLCFGASSDPTSSSTSPAENRAAPLLALRAMMVLRRHSAQCRGHDAISTQTQLITTCVSHLFCPHSSQGTSQSEHMKHHCPTLDDVCYRKETQRAPEVLGRNFRMCATPERPARARGAAMWSSACTPSPLPSSSTSQTRFQNPNPGRKLACGLGTQLGPIVVLKGESASGLAGFQPNMLSPPVVPT